MANIVSAVFDDEFDAENVVDWLRDEGVLDDAITVVRRDEESGRKGGAATLERDAGTEWDARDTAMETGKGALTGLGAGAGVGALFGLAAAMIPGVGPFITAGALSTLGAVGGGAAAGAIVGGTSGALAGALARWGVSEPESAYYADEVDRGATYVGVDLDRTDLTRDEVMDAFRRFSGGFADVSAW